MSITFCAILVPILQRSVRGTFCNLPHVQFRMVDKKDRREEELCHCKMYMWALLLLCLRIYAAAMQYYDQREMPNKCFVVSFHFIYSHDSRHGHRLTSADQPDQVAETRLTLYALCTSHTKTTTVVENSSWRFPGNKRFYSPVEVELSAE